MSAQSEKICVVGLGYVGLPVAVAFSKKYETYGIDINGKRISELESGRDVTNEVPDSELAECKIKYSTDIQDAKDASFYIVTVPTPIDTSHRPDLRAIYASSKSVGSVLKKGDMVVYESTVYPGLTRDRCIPILEEISGLKAGTDFQVGYSPERINPGDKEHRFESILKVTSGMDRQAAERVTKTYASVVTAGVFEAASMEAAEAAKVIENTQRDLNVALVNELSIIFDRLNIDTRDVLAAAGTKWNFLKFEPGIVGGHCIGVDPYYLTHRAEEVGYAPQVILSGRRVNSEMGRFIAQKTIKILAQKGATIANSRVTLLGVTFKENCPDIRNSRSFDIVDELRDYGIEVQCSDAEADPAEVRQEYGYELTAFEDLKPADAVIVAVKHKAYQELGPDQLLSLFAKNRLLVDIKGVFDRSKLRELNIDFWRL